ncbi:aldehyde dehydrogenase family protein [Escherichia coli]
MCTNGTRVFVPAKCKAAFEQKILARVERIRAGDVFDPELTSARWSASRIAITCCAISPKAKRKAREWRGGDVLKGYVLDNGAWVAPTVFTDCSDEMTIVREEIFGW